MIDVPVAPSRLMAVKLDALKVVLWVSVTVLCVHAIAAVALGVNLYADGAWFDFALLSGEPFKLVWHNYPLRQTHYWLIYAPALALLKLHAPRWLVLLTAHALWNAAPLASLAVCRTAAPKVSITLPAAFFAIVGLLTWAFPTETWLLAVFIWPAFYALSFGENRLQLAIGAVAIMACAMSYEAWIAFAPLFIFAAARRSDAQWPMRTVLIGIGGAVLLSAVAVALIRPAQTANVQLVINAAHMLSADVLHFPPIRKAAGVVLTFGLAVTVDRLRPANSTIILLVATVVALCIVAMPMSGFEIMRYNARTVVLIALWLVLAALALGDRLSSSLRAPPAFQAATALLLILVVSAENARFIGAWLTYENRIREATACRDVCGQITEFAWSSDTARVEWPWGLPFRSWLMADDQRKMNIPAEPVQTRWPSALLCSDAQRLTRQDVNSYRAFLRLCR